MLRKMGGKKDILDSRFNAYLEDGNSTFDDSENQ